MAIPSRPAVVLAFALVTAASSAETAPAQRILIPVFTAEPIAGVNGSSWITDLRLSNSGDAEVLVNGVVWECAIPECGFLPAPLQPGVTMNADLEMLDGGLRGFLIDVDDAGAESLGLGLRFRDLSRQATTWGTELPTPRESEFRASKFSLVDVPVSEGFRRTLRIYELDGTPREATVRIRIYAIDTANDQPSGSPDVLLGETERALAFFDSPVEPSGYPGYAEVTDLSTIAPLGDAESLLIEIEPASEGLKLWAFVTVIHNESQHATVISPQ